MQLPSHNVLDTGRRVQTLLDSQSAVLGTAVPAPLRAQLDTAVTQLATSGNDQESLGSATRGEQVNQVAMRKALTVDFLDPMARIARHALRASPDFQALVVPAFGLRKGDFMNKVNAIVDAAVKHEQDFVDHGMPAAFIAQLRAAVGALNASVDTRGKQKGLLKQAGQGIKDSTKAVRDVLHVIDGNMKRVLKKNQPVLANWTATKRIQATVVTPLPGGDLNATPSAPQPVAPAAATPVTTAPAKPAA
jgi:hypothetical protein